VVYILVYKFNGLFTMVCVSFQHVPSLILKMKILLWIYWLL